MSGTEAKKPNWRKFILSMAVGGIVGFVGAFTVMRLGGAGLFGSIGASGTIALLVALMYVIMGLAVGAGVVMPSYGANILNVEDADELREMRPSLINSAAGTMALGLMLFIIVLGGDGGVISPHVALAISAAVFAAAAWSTFRSLGHSDELMRAVGIETAGMGYYLSFVLIGGWALLAHFGFIRAPEMIEILTLFWALILIAAFWVCGKRGMLMPR